MDDNEKTAKIAAGLGIGKLSRHILLCADQTKPKCCDKDAGIAAWDHLKSRLDEKGLTKGPNPVFRTKANCLRICEQGPIAVVYPEGVWYRLATPDVLDRIIDEHLAAGRIVEEFVITRDPLSGRQD